MFSTPGTVRAFCSTSDTSLSTRSGLAPGYTVTTIRYGVLTSGSRLVCIFVMATKPRISTITTATSTVNGFLTLNFSIFPTVSLPCTAAPQSLPPQEARSHFNIPIIHRRRRVATEPVTFFHKTFLFAVCSGPNSVTLRLKYGPEGRIIAPGAFCFLRGNVLLNMVY